MLIPRVDDGVAPSQGGRRRLLIRVVHQKVDSEDWVLHMGWSCIIDRRRKWSVLSRWRRDLRKIWVRGRLGRNGRSCRCGGKRRGCKRVGKWGGKKGRAKEGGEVCLNVRNSAGAHDFGLDFGRGGAGPIFLELIDFVVDFFLLYNGLG